MALHGSEQSASNPLSPKALIDIHSAQDQVAVLAGDTNCGDHFPSHATPNYGVAGPNAATVANTAIERSHLAVLLRSYLAYLKHRRLL